jgi:hypothetical protein
VPLCCSGFVCYFSRIKYSKDALEELKRQAQELKADTPHLREPWTVILVRRKDLSMKEGAWIREFPAAITVCDPNGIILALNDRSCATFAGDGGPKLVGTNMLECHPEPARSKVEELLQSKTSNVYTIEKNGIKKLIYQSPWYEDGKFAGLVELSLPIPKEMPHFVRDTK